MRLEISKPYSGCSARRARMATSVLPRAILDRIRFVMVNIGILSSNIGFLYYRFFVKGFSCPAGRMVTNRGGQSGLRVTSDPGVHAPQISGGAGEGGDQHAAELEAVFEVDIDNLVGELVGPRVPHQHMGLQSAPAGFDENIRFAAWRERL